MARRKQESLFPEGDDIIARLSREARQELVIIAIPSHDRRNKPIGEAKQAEWASAAMALFADLFRGATSFHALHGVFKTDEGHILHDTPILVESFARQSDIESSENLDRLAKFARRMGRETNQSAVMLVVGQVMIYIEDFTSALEKDEG